MIFEKSKRLVFKVGSALLVESKNYTLNQEWFDSFIDDIITLKKSGHEIVIVSSGTVALGRHELGMSKRALRLEEKQAAAASGQIILANAYHKAFAKYGVKTAQVLLTWNDTETRQRYVNAKSTINTLLQYNTIPVVNENDTVATAELRYGDNDRLSARIANMVDADCLILVSDIDGLYTADPNIDKNATLIETVKTITPNIESIAGASASDYGSGGMATKVAAAKIAVQSGCNMKIISGRRLNPIKFIQEGGKHTTFVSSITPQAAKKQWIGGTLKPSGTLYIDNGAEAALLRGKSLLPAGVLKMEGDFKQGDCVKICNQNNEEIARGLINYHATETIKIIRRRSEDIEAILGYQRRDELVHRDELVVLKTV
jgi:glutamate 5-kinase